MHGYLSGFDLPCIENSIPLSPIGNDTHEERGKENLKKKFLLQYKKEQHFGWRGSREIRKVHCGLDGNPGGEQMSIC